LARFRGSIHQRRSLGWPQNGSQGVVNETEYY
jgi:hypothetical protein